MSKVLRCCKDVVISAPGYVLLNIVVLICVSLAQVGMNYYMGVLVQAISSGHADTVKEIGIPILCFAICVCIGGNTVNMNDLLCNLFVKRSKKHIYNTFIEKILAEKQDSFSNSEFMEKLTFAKVFKSICPIIRWKKFM